MFNGIIKNTGRLIKLEKKGKSCLIELKTDLKFKKKEIGSSISCSGACLTLKSYKGKVASFFLSFETLKKTNFLYKSKGSIINMEKSLKFGDRLSGHFVQGHVDTISKVNKINIVGKSWFVSFNISSRYKKHIVEKGSICINGVSLTISKILKSGFQVVVIPQTLKLTDLYKLKEKEIVNIEFDILGKYIKNFLNEKK